MNFSDRAWSPYATGIIIGLLQIPAFLLVQTALGTSSSYVTIAAHIAALFDGSVAKMDYLAKHMWGAKNLWQLAMVGGIVLGAYLSMKASGASRAAISPVWQRATGMSTLVVACADGFRRRLHHGAGRPHRRRMHDRSRHLRHCPALGWIDGRRRVDVRWRHHGRPDDEARLKRRLT